MGLGQNSDFGGFDAVADRGVKYEKEVSWSRRGLKSE
jgi:hypothetical protein